MEFIRCASEMIPCPGDESEVMKFWRPIFWLWAALSLTGCDGKNGSGGGGSASTNLSIVVWSPFLPTPGSYQHLQHLGQLRQKARVLMATNSSIFGWRLNPAKLPKDSPLRNLLGIPLDESAYMRCGETGVDQVVQNYIIIYSPKSEQRFGEVKVNRKTGLVDSAYDVESLFVLSEMERRLRQVVGTRQEALRLFSQGSRTSTSPEQQRAKKALFEALFLPPDADLAIRMSAASGSNEGQGHLAVLGDFGIVATVDYPIDDDIRSAFGLSHPSYKFGGLRLYPPWTNLNTQGFLIDSGGIPYPKTHS